MSERDDDDYVEPNDEKSERQEVEETIEEGTKEGTREGFKEGIEDYEEESGGIRDKLSGTGENLNRRDFGLGVVGGILGGALLYGGAELADEYDFNIGIENGEEGAPGNGAAPGVGTPQQQQQQQRTYLFESLNDIPEPWCYPGPNEGDQVNLVGGYDANDVDGALGSQATGNLQPVDGIYAVDIDYDGDRGGYFAQLLGGGNTGPIALTTNQAEQVADLNLEVAYADCVDNV